MEMCCYTQPSLKDNQSCCGLLPDILPHGHGCNNLLYSFFPLLFLLIIEFSLQFKNLSWQKTKQTELLGRAGESHFRDGSRGTYCFPGLFPLDRHNSTWKLTDLTENTGQGEPKLRLSGVCYGLYLPKEKAVTKNHAACCSSPTSRTLNHITAASASPRQLLHNQEEKIFGDTRFVPARNN